MSGSLRWIWGRQFFILGHRFSGTFSGSAYVSGSTRMLYVQIWKYVCRDSSFQASHKLSTHFVAQKWEWTEALFSSFYSLVRPSTLTISGRSSFKATSWRSSPRVPGRITSEITRCLCGRHPHWMWFGRRSFGSKDGADWTFRQIKDQTTEMELKLLASSAITWWRE